MVCQQQKKGKKTLTDSLISEFRVVDSQHDVSEIDMETFYMEWYTFVSMKTKENKTMTIGSTLIALGRLLKSKQLEYDIDFARKMRRKYLLHVIEDTPPLQLSSAEQEQMYDFMRRFVSWRKNERLYHCLRLFIARSGIHSISSFRNIDLADINRFVVQGLLDTGQWSLVLIP